MVTIEIDGDALDIQVQGIHKMWALKSSLRVPLSDVRDVRHDPERATRFMPRLRMPGTHIPYVYTAGTVDARSAVHGGSCRNPGPGAQNR